MIRLFLVLSLFIIIPLCAQAAGIDGFWLASKKQDIVVEIAPCGDAVCGHIVWMNEEETRENPEICGVRVLYDLVRDGDGAVWSGGQVYDAADDETFAAQLKLLNTETLELRGFIGARIFGKTYEFARVDVADYPPCQAPSLRGGVAGAAIQ